MSLCSSKSQFTGVEMLAGFVGPQGMFDSSNYELLFVKERVWYIHCKQQLTHISKEKQLNYVYRYMFIMVNYMYVQTTRHAFHHIL